MTRKKGRWYTRCWDIRKVNGKKVQVMYEIPTDPKAVRPERASCLWSPEAEKSDTSLKKALLSAGISGQAGGFSI